MATISVPSQSERALDERLERLEARVRELEAARPRDLRRDDHALLDALRRIGPVVFNTAEVLRHAGLDPVLEDALTAAGLTTVSRVGRRLARLARRGCLERVGRDVSGAIWCVSQLRLTDT